LKVSYLLRNWSPLATAVMLAAAFALVICNGGTLVAGGTKALLVIVLLLSIVPAWFARQNHFEWMFNPLKHSAYVKATDASFVRDLGHGAGRQDQQRGRCLSGEVDGLSPCRAGRVGGTPICATY